MNEHFWAWINCFCFLSPLRDLSVFFFSQSRLLKPHTVPERLCECLTVNKWYLGFFFYFTEEYLILQMCPNSSNSHCCVKCCLVQISSETVSGPEVRKPHFKDNCNDTNNCSLRAQPYSAVCHVARFMSVSIRMLVFILLIIKDLWI